MIKIFSTQFVSFDLDIKCMLNQIWLKCLTISKNLIWTQYNLIKIDQYVELFLKIWIEHKIIQCTIMQTYTLQSISTIQYNTIWAPSHLRILDPPPPLKKCAKLKYHTIACANMKQLRLDRSIRSMDRFEIFDISGTGPRSLISKQMN